MPSYRLTRPRIIWGPTLSTWLTLGYPLDNVSAGDEPREGSETVQTPSGVEDSWRVGTDYVLTADVRFIPPTDTSSPLATGWDGTLGFRAFLAWARDKNVIRFLPDANDAGTYIDCYLVAPMTGQGTSENDGTRMVTLKLRNSATPFDGY